MPMKEKTVDQLLRETWLSVAKYYNDEAAKFGGTMTIGFTLLNIDPKEGTPSTVLPAKMGLEVTGLTRTLNKMLERGLIYKEANPKDRRSVIIRLTPLGVEMRNKAKETVLALNEKIAYYAGEERLKCLREMMEIILDLTQRKNQKSP